MWRKNRRPVGNNFGIDLNRNWNNNWLGKCVSDKGIDVSFKRHSAERSGFRNTKPFPMSLNNDTRL